MKKHAFQFAFYACFFLAISFLFSACSADAKYTHSKKQEMQQLVQTKNAEITQVIQELESLYNDYRQDYLKLSPYRDNQVLIEFGSKLSNPPDYARKELSNPDLSNLFHGCTFRYVVITDASIKFVGNGSGFGSNTTSIYLYYVPTDEMECIPEYDYLAGIHYETEGEGIYGTVRGRDNTVYIERIEPCFFYVEARF